MADRPPIRPSFQDQRNPGALRRQAASGDDLLLDESVSARKLTPESFQDHFARRDKTVPTEDAKPPGYHPEEYKALHEAAPPKDEEPVAVARGKHNHDYSYIDQREAVVQADQTEMYDDPLPTVTSGACEPYTSRLSNRAVYWEYTGIPSPFRIYAEYSQDAGTTWTEPRLVGCAPPGAVVFRYSAPPVFDFKGADGTPAQDRYYVHALNQMYSRALRIVRTGTDGKIDVGFMPSTLATDAEIAAAIAAHAALSDPHTGYQKESEKDAASGYAGVDAAVAVLRALALRETSGPTNLVVAAVADGQFLKRVGATIVSAAVAAPPGPATTVTDETTFGVAKAVGTATTYAREDHTHGTMSDPVTAHVALGDPHTQYQKESELNAASGYAGLNADSRTTRGVDATDDVIVDSSSKGLVLKDPAGTPHYWRVSVSAGGVLSTADLGTTKP